MSRGVSQKNERVLSDLFKFRDLHQFILHNFAGLTNALTALIANRDKLPKLLKRLRMVLSHRLTNCLITDTITQANVHDHSRSKTAQIVNENDWLYKGSGEVECREW
jgi:hypothetical protein